MNQEDVQRWDEETSCLVCGGYPSLKRGVGERCHGFVTSDGTGAHCSREEYAGTLPKLSTSDTFRHEVVGPCGCGKRHDTDESTAEEPAAATPPRGRGRPRKAPRDGAAAGSKEPVAIYAYRDADAQVVYHVLRYANPKAFVQRRPDGAGGWIWKGPGASERVLYRLPQLLAADPKAPVLVTEGEKDADRLAALGFVATTNAGGARKWQDSYTQTLSGRHVRILGDNDPDGRAHAQVVAQALHGVAASLKVLIFDELPAGGDVSAAVGAAC